MAFISGRWTISLTLKRSLREISSKKVSTSLKRFSPNFKEEIKERIAIRSSGVKAESFLILERETSSLNTYLLTSSSIRARERKVLNIFSLGSKENKGRKVLTTTIGSI